MPSADPDTTAAARPCGLVTITMLAIVVLAVPKDSSAAPPKPGPNDSSANARASTGPVPKDSSPSARASAEPVPKDSSTPAVSTAPAEPAPRLRALVLRLEGPTLADLRPALALRMPSLPIVDEAPPGAVPFVFVAVRSDPRAPTRHQIGLITSDGAAYFREVDTGADPPARVLASVLANLLVSIAEGSVRPDRTDVEIPTTGAPLPDPEPAPAPIQPAPPSAPTVSQPVPKDIPPPAAPRWQYALVAAGTLDVALGPPAFGRTLGGGGGSLGLDARSPRGALVGGELRLLGRGAEAHRLLRMRIAVLGGYVLRRGRFELPLALGLTFEPWWVGPASDVAATRGARPLLGALFRVAPGVHIERPRGALRGVRIGPRLELAGSFAVDDGAKIVGVSLGQGADNRALFRLGGLELNVGLEVALWFGRR